jgi:hypothetical protein
LSSGLWKYIEGNFTRRCIITEITGKSPRIPHHVNWLINTGKILKTSEGNAIDVYELTYEKDEMTLSSWAAHFRNHYCLDTEIDLLRDGTGKSRAQYLKEIKFPDEREAPGPSIRAGDFGEILVADYVHFVLKYWVPRTRYANKIVRNESTKGTDIIGFKIGGSEESLNDSLIVVEAKAKLTGNTPINRLQDAINDSSKDIIRKAESLNAIKQRFLDKERLDLAKIVQRFQNKTDSPYKESSGAAAVICNSVYDESMICNTSVADHPNSGNLMLLIIKGEALMELANELYRRAADEA